MLVMQGGRLLADGPVRELLTDIPLLELARLNPPDITRFFYKKALLENRKPERLPLTLDEALQWRDIAEEDVQGNSAEVNCALP